jgi:hypothetical protein
MLPEPLAPWLVSREPVPALVEHMAEHLREDAATGPADRP